MSDIQLVEKHCNRVLPDGHQPKHINLKIFELGLKNQNAIRGGTELKELIFLTLNSHFLQLKQTSWNHN